MGVVAQDVSRISDPVKNANYGAGQGPSGRTVPFTRPSVSSSISSKTSLQVAESAIANARGAFTKNKVVVAISLLDTAYNALSGLYNSLSGDDAQAAKAKMDELLSEKQKLQYQQETDQLTMQKADELNDFLTRQQNAMTPPATGETLPAVLTRNAKELVTSVNKLNSTLGEKFDYFNNYFYGFLTYMDIATGLMDKTYTLNKELADNAKKKEDDNTLQVGDSKMSPAEIEARKNLAMLKAYDFKNTPVEQSVLEADNVLGMTPLQIEASHRSFEVEAKVYAKTPQKVKDWDENELADIAPREARLVKDATAAIKNTDENNFELDDEDVDLITPLDIKSVFGYDGDSATVQELFKRLGGVGLPTT
jgi:hypothetical protein